MMMVIVRKLKEMKQENKKKICQKAGKLNKVSQEIIKKEGK